MFEEQAMRDLSELYLYLPSNNTNLFYFILNKNSPGYLNHRKNTKIPCWVLGAVCFQ